MSRDFAFGNDEVDGCKCPARQAGYARPIEQLSDVVRNFDRILSEEVGESEGVVAEECARDTWLEVLDGLEESRLQAIGLEEGWKVARELGWAE